jgi:hypothetical protein
MGRTAYDFNEHGLKNIRTYVRNFELPRPDALSEKDLLFMLGQGPRATRLATDVNKSHKNTLESRHEKWRYLENIRHLSLEVISPLKCESLLIGNQRAGDERNISSRDKYRAPQYAHHSWSSVLQPTIYTCVSAPAAVLSCSNRHREVCSQQLSQVESSRSRIFFSMVPWLNLLLVTATRILHISHTGTESFAFQPLNNTANDRNIFRYLIWSDKDAKSHEPRGSVLVAYQPPYILTPTDLEEFVSCKAVRVLPRYEKSNLTGLF